MKTIKLITLFLFAILLMNCRKDDDNPQPEPDPYSGYWAKKITYHSSNPGDDPFIVEFSYANGSVSKMNFTMGSNTTEYDIEYDPGAQSKVYRNGTLLYTLDYNTSNKINKWSGYDSSGNLTYAYDIAYNNGTYSMAGNPMVVTQNENELKSSQFASLDDITYNDNPGIHQHVTMRPEIYFIDDINVFFHHVISKREISTYTDGSGLYNVEVIRDSDHKITEMRGIKEGTTAVKDRWVIEYEVSTTIL